MQTFTSRSLVFITITFSLSLLLTKGYAHSAGDLKRMVVSAEPEYSQISIDILKYETTGLNMYDNATCDFIEGANAGLDGNDATKPSQFAENLSIYRFGKDLSWETRPSIKANDTIQLRMWGMKQANYQLKFDLTNFNLSNGSVIVLLKDQFLKKETSISLTTTTLINFSVIADSASADKRFQVVILFRSNAPTPVFNLNAAKAIKIYPNPVVRGGLVQVDFHNRVAGKYTMTLYTLTGIRVQQSIVRHNGGSSVQSIALDAHLNRGAYLLEVMNEKGEKDQAKMVVE